MAKVVFQHRVRVAQDDSLPEGTIFPVRCKRGSGNQLRYISQHTVAGRRFLVESTISNPPIRFERTRDAEYVALDLVGIQAAITQTMRLSLQAIDQLTATSRRYRSSRGMLDDNYDVVITFTTDGEGKRTGDFAATAIGSSIHREVPTLSPKEVKALRGQSPV